MPTASGDLGKADNIVTHSQGRNGVVMGFNLTVLDACPPHPSRSWRRLRQGKTSRMAPVAPSKPADPIKRNGVIAHPARTGGQTTFPRTTGWPACPAHMLASVGTLSIFP